jgi:hypothetical protein
MGRTAPRKTRQLRLTVAVVAEHVAADRDRAIAEALSGLASAKVVPLRAVRVPRS